MIEYDHIIRGPISHPRAGDEPDYTIAVKRIPETIVEGKRLGRHIKHDSRSLKFRAEMAMDIVSVKHEATGLPLDQGSIGSCTANALVGALDSQPNIRMPIRLEPDAVELYKRETADEGQPYPPNDPGGTGVAVCKAAQELKWITSYQTPTGIDEALRALVVRPVITGVDWWSGFDSPDTSGLVSISGSIRGGHEFVADEIDAPNELVWFWNSWGAAYGQGGRFCMKFDTWDKLLQAGGDATVPIL